MTMNRIDHTAIVVRALDEAIPRHEQLYGVKCRERHTVPEQGVEVAFLPIGDTQLELIAPIDFASGVARFLETHGEGLHHIGVLVDDIRVELARLQAQGVRLIDTEPRANFHGLIAFVHPKGTGGVLLELVQARE